MMNHRALLLTFLLALPSFCRAALEWEALRSEQSATAGDQQVVAIYRFKNPSATPVTIVSVQTTCGCTTTEMPKKIFQPGEAGFIKALFNVGDLVGPQEKHIEITTDDAPAHPVTLVLRVNIAEVVACTPRLLFWGIGEAQTKKAIKLHAIGAAAITALEPPADLRGFSANLETIVPGKIYRLWLTPESTDGPKNAVVRCMAHVEGRPPLAAIVYALVK